MFRLRPKLLPTMAVQAPLVHAAAQGSAAQPRPLGLRLQGPAEAHAS